ncbi:MAG: hypothetical protein ABIW33_00360 [Sphingomicrobium sp.]
MVISGTRNSSLQFFLDRADQARLEGEAATLEHVRERCQRSEAAWAALAARANRSELLRIEETKRKAATNAALSDEEQIEDIEDNADAEAYADAFEDEPTES